MLTILVSYPFLCKYPEIKTKPIGYISNTGVEGITSLIGPYITDFFLKSYMLGG
jgi:hypothetical protein